MMRKISLKIALIDRYIISQLIPPLIFAVAICTIVGELIGITFEQVKFVTSDGLSVAIAAYVHLLKLPAFISVGLPLSLLMATMITYSQLSARNEIIALQSYGVSLFRLLIPVLLVGFLVTDYVYFSRIYRSCC
ncbi:MAG: hypothetical protein Tsb0014_20030 [Pleurocapsa sp.]